VRFEVFYENNTPALHSSRVTSLYEAADGVLWIGFEGGQVCQYQKGQFKAVEFHPAWNGGKIYDIASDESGDVWLLNESGQLARARDGRVVVPEAGAVAKLVDMTRSVDGTIWIAREGRVSVLKQARIQPLQFGEDTNVAYPYVQGIGASRDGGLWVASDGRIRKWRDGKWAEDLEDAPCHPAGGNPKRGIGGGYGRERSLPGLSGPKPKTVALRSYQRLSF
jgi:ligand-binding sensor domain-containing protein